MTIRLHQLHLACSVAFLAASVGFLASCGSLDSEHREALRCLEGLWKTPHYYVLPTGSVQIMRQDVAATTGQLGPDALKAYYVLRDMNKIKILSDIDYTNSSSFSWNNFWSLTQKGVIRSLTISPVDAALVCQGGDTRHICVDDGSRTKQEVVRTERFRIGTTQHWLIMGTYRWTFPDTFRRILAAQSRPLDNNWKVMVLGKYDDFKKDWLLYMQDDAPENGQFARQQYFDNVLRQGSTGNSPR